MALSRLTIGICFALALSACSKDDEKKDFSGALGTCTFTTELTTPVAGKSIVCAEFSYSGKAEKDPKDDLLAQAKTGCVAEDGMGTAAFAEAPATCSLEGSVGSCVSSSKDGDNTIDTKEVYSGSLMTAAAAEASCTQSGGTFTAK